MWVTRPVLYALGAAALFVTTALPTAADGGERGEPARPAARLAP